ncbi:MAG: hypothetical protein A2W23_03375 [Planctomycetes bacterium RBG_16_43_13]|nr:MAG: hypothetical protein A2W23_03375 [Planctomycetes bacterium RBG_16_43_13]
MSNNYRESELIKRCIKGDNSAYLELIEQIEKPLINFIFRYIGEIYEAEDIFQETFVKVFKSLKDYRPTASLTTWVFTIARNLCLDHLKYKRRHKSFSLDNVLKEKDENVIYFKEINSGKNTPPDDTMEKQEDEDKIRIALTLLTEKHREAIVLRIYSGLSYAEIADIVKAPVGTVKYRVHEALQMLAKKLAEMTDKERKEDIG